MSALSFVWDSQDPQGWVIRILGVILFYFANFVVCFLQFNLLNIQFLKLNSRIAPQADPCFLYTQLGYSTK